MSKRLITATMILFLVPSLLYAELRVPAATAYLEPDHGARVLPDKGVTNWMDPNVSVQWFGNFKHTGKLNVSIVMRLPVGSRSDLELEVEGQRSKVAVEGRADSISADFGEFEIAETGYHSLTLRSLNTSGKRAGDLETLVLDGVAIRDAHFNLKPRRNAASVHLFYPHPLETKVSAFYCEMTGLEDPLWTYYMACGWHRGYFGMQVNSPNERRVIFSVWDSGNEAVDRKKVDKKNRVTLVAKGKDVYSGSFGNEGTGGHSHLKFMWKTGKRQRFLVTAEPVDQTHTIFAGYYFRRDQQKWMLISSWKAPKEGAYLRGLYSFSENFVGRNGHVLRKARYGNQWIRDAKGNWIELTTAKFSHDSTGKADRLDRFMGVEEGEFFLSHGGFMSSFTAYGESFTRAASKQSPASMKLPPLPATVQ